MHLYRRFNALAGSSKLVSGGEACVCCHLAVDGACGRGLSLVEECEFRPLKPDVSTGDLGAVKGASAVATAGEKGNCTAGAIGYASGDVAQHRT
jgi:hypothetical protein